jgi:hypothetical protein
LQYSPRSAPPYRTPPVLWRLSLRQRNHTHADRPI